MNSNSFFKKKSLKLDKIFKNIKLQKNFQINDVKPLHLAKSQDISFFDSIKYKIDAENTKAGACITLDKYKGFLPSSTQQIIVTNVLFELAKTLKKLYPTADIDYPDLSLKKPSKKKIQVC